MSTLSPRELDTSNPGTWPVVYKILLWVLCIVLVVFLYKQFFYDDLISTQESNKESIATLEKDYKTFFQYEKDLPLYKQRQKELKGELLKLLKVLPSKTDMESVINQIYSSSYQNGLNFTQFIPQEQVKEKYYNKQPILLSTEAGFDAFRKFAEAINQFPRIVNISNMEMTATKSLNNQLIMNMILETYIYNQDLSVFGLEEGGN